MRPIFVRFNAVPVDEGQPSRPVLINLVHVTDCTWADVHETNINLAGDDYIAVKGSLGRVESTIQEAMKKQ